jgi:nucleotide-binding universal stress UspA family protein
MHSAAGARKGADAVIALQRIVCPVDFSDCSRRALEHAVALARASYAGLTVLHVYSGLSVEDLLPLSNEVVARAVDPDVLRRELEAFVHSVACGLPIATHLTRADDVAGAIADAAATHAADLLVIGSRGRGRLERLLVGSTTERVVAKAACSVLVVPPQATTAHPDGFQRIVCGIDFSPASLAAARHVLSWTPDAAETTLVHAIEVPPEVREAQMIAAFDVDAVRAATEAACLERLRSLELGAASGRRIDRQVVEGPACRHVLRLAEERRADLIVLGSRHHGAIDRLVFGSHVHAVLRHATCPVLMVRA